MHMMVNKINFEQILLGDATQSSAERGTLICYRMSPVLICPCVE